MKFLLTLRAAVLPALPVTAWRRLERRDRVVPREVDPLSVGDHRVVGASAAVEDDLSRARVCAEGRLRVEVGVVDDIPDHADAARDAATGLLRPACRSSARIERIEVAVVGADEDRRAESP